MTTATATEAAAALSAQMIELWIDRAALAFREERWEDGNTSARLAEQEAALYIRQMIDARTEHDERTEDR